MKNDEIYLKHILDAIEKVEKYIVDMDFEMFTKDDKTVDAVLKELEIMGEAANRVSENFKDSHPEIPYRDMADMRNVLIHEYFGVVRKTVWDTAKGDLPPLKQTVLSILENLECKKGGVEK